MYPNKIFATTEIGPTYREWGGGAIRSSRKIEEYISPIFLPPGLLSSTQKCASVFLDTLEACTYKKWPPVKIKAFKANGVRLKATTLCH